MAPRSRPARAFATAIVDAVAIGFVVFVVVIAAPARPALAWSAGDDPIPRGPALDWEIAPHERWSDESTSSTWIALQIAHAHLASGRREIGALVLLGLPLDRAARAAPSSRPAGPRPLGAIAEPPPPPSRDGAPALEPPSTERSRGPRGPVQLKPAPPERAARDALGPERPIDAKLEATPATHVEAARAPPVTLPRSSVRAIVRDALRVAKLSAPEARLDSLATRARTSALLPELRLRATRLVDEGESLSPTEYDPRRTTAFGGTSVWLEVRATWRLDRLVYVDDEVALERLRYDRAEAQAKLVARVLELVATWQRAATAERDDALPADARERAALQRVEAETALDVLTAGAFGPVADRHHGTPP